MKSFAAFVGVVGVVGVLATWGLARADVRAEMMAASEKVQARMGDANTLLAEGKIDQINRTILETFPEDSRTAVQSLILGNALFRHDPKQSYALHKRAAAELPNEPMAQLEWAMEQQRAGEYEGAGKTYEKFVGANPQFGPALGMWSECLIRTGKVKEATETWIKSEQGGGSLEQFESWVCEVHNHRVPDRERADLIKKVAAGDAAAGVQLVALDCDFERDWWNRGPQEAYLKKDLELLNDANFPDTGATREARCAAECGIIQASGEGNVRTVLRKYGLLVDEKATLPSEDALLSPLFASALDHGLSQADARAKFGQRVLDRAKASRNAEVYNVVTHLYLETDKLPEIDQAGWDATGDARFAGSLLAGLMAKDALKLDDPRLEKALEQFPLDAQIRQVQVVLARKSGKLTSEMLVEAIKAEFTHFSYAGGLIGGRPGATALRAYFSELSKQMNVKVAEGGEPKFTVRGQYLAGVELRLIMETSREYRPQFSHSTKTADAKGWLITVDLGKKGDMASRSKVYGPLWDVPDPRSSISFDAGPQFTKEDRDAASATQFVTFDENGTLVRIRGDKGGVMTKEHLVIGGEGASWKGDGAYKPVEGFKSWPSEEQVDSNSRTFHLQETAGKARLYDTLNARDISDPWLTLAFEQYLHGDHLKNVQLILTDDLKYLVCNPSDMWRDGFGQQAPLYKTFELDGKTYSRAEYGLVWSRPEKQPAVFKKEPGRAVSVRSGPSGAYSIDGKLYLHYEPPKRLRLVPLDGGKAYETEAPTDPAFEWVGGKIQHVARADQLVFFADDFMTQRHRMPDEMIYVFVWSFKKGTVETYSAHTAELFEKKGSEYAAKGATGVK